MAVSFLREADISYPYLALSLLPFVGTFTAGFQVFQLHYRLGRIDVQLQHFFHAQLIRKKIVVYSLATAVGLFSTFLFRIALVFLRIIPFYLSDLGFIGTAISFCYIAYRTFGEIPPADPALDLQPNNGQVH